MIMAISAEIMLQKSGLAFKNFHQTIENLIMHESFRRAQASPPHFKVIVALGVDVKCVLVKIHYFNAWP